MPLYEYECPKDGTFEQMRKFSDPPLTACPTCGGPIEKLLSAPAIQFKGTGWYVTDYARKGAGKSAGKDGDAGKDSGPSKDATSGKDSGSGKDTTSSKESSAGKESTSSKTSDSTKK